MQKLTEVCSYTVERVSTHTGFVTCRQLLLRVNKITEGQGSSCAVYGKDLCDVDAAACVVVALLVKPKKKRKKRVWMKEWLKRRNQFTHEILLNELRTNEPNDFKNFVR
ncbi:hypothetical protein J6590_006345 [Homalodisca vitripennis]|nr:hypothetical protein J6590_006345 [Homalodisca vitripennis]